MHLGRPVGGSQEAVRQLHKVVLLSLALVRACMCSRPGVSYAVMDLIRTSDASGTWAACGRQEAVRQLHKVVLLSLALVRGCMCSRPGCSASVFAQIKYAHLMHPESWDGRSKLRTSSTSAAPAWGQQSSGQAHSDSCG